MALDKLTSDMITDSAITAAKIADGTVVAAEIADDAVTTAKIADANITTALVADDAVTTAKIADANITTALVADDAVTTAKIADSAITDAKISAVAATKLSGTIADARFPATLPAVSGANLTNLPSEVTKSSSDPPASTNPSGGVGTLFLNTTSGEMFACTDATNNANVWKNLGDGSKGYMTATGGTVSYDGDYKVHVFNSSGNFQVTNVGHPGTVEYLIIAGGGGGGTGGGGAGGYLTASNLAVTVQTYTVTVGAGGVKGNPGTDGGDSSFGGITADGGGGGVWSTAGRDGGSGSGAGYGSVGGSVVAGGSGTAGQGNAGGTSTVYSTAGGGGAGEVGASTTNASIGGKGGDGLASSITGWSVTRAGGGGGGSSGTDGQGGLGGGGQADRGTGPASGGGSNGVPNTGGGGGGSWNVQAGNAGSGVVIIRYKYKSDFTHTGWECVTELTIPVDSSSVEFTNMEAGYDYEYVLDKIRGDDNGAGFYLQLGVAGPTYRTSGSTYDCVVTEVSTHVSGGEIQARADTSRIDILDNAESALGTGTNEALHMGKLFLNNPAGSTNETTVMGTVVNFGSDPVTPEVRTHHIAGFYKTAEAHPCIRFVPNTGKLDTGKIFQYRRKRSAT